MLEFSWPITAVVSIMHRVAGVGIFAGIFFLLYALDKSLVSEEGFREVLALLELPLVKLIAWLIVSAVIYHFVAGIKHLLLDLGIAETLEGSILAARTTLLLSAILILLAGIWII